MRGLLRPRLIGLRPSSIHHHHHHQPLHPFLKLTPDQRKTLVTPSFPNLTNLTSEPQSLQASRTLSYPSSALYSIIADVNSYSHFLPYCTSSRVIEWSNPDPVQNKRWPYVAAIQVGWGGYTETITSKVLCDPPYTLEAIGGEAESTIDRSDLPHYYPDDLRRHQDYDGTHNQIGSSSAAAAAAAAVAVAEDTSLFKYLYTRWTIRPFPYKPPAKDQRNPLHGEAKADAVEKSDVNLKLEFCFANPIYAAMSRAVAPKVAQLMVEAFEKRVVELLGKEREGEGQPVGREVERKEKRGSLDGVTEGGGMEQGP